MNDAAPDTPPFRRWLLRVLAALLVLGALAYAARDRILGMPVEVYRLARGDLLQTVVASGRIMSPRRVSIGAVVTGRVVRIPVSEGQAVRRGDLLIELLDNDERAAEAQAKAAVAQAEARLRQLREVGLPAAEQAVLQAQATLTQMRQQHARTTQLQAQGFVGRAQLDDAQRNLDVAESQLRAARLQVQTNRPTGSDFALASTALAQARASLGIAHAKLTDTLIRAPVDGTLIGRNVEAGDVVQPGRALMVLAPAGDTEIVVQIDERNLARLALGQQALASADSYPGRRFPAQLAYINPGVDPLRGSVEVKLKVPEPPGFLRQDMTVSVDIEVARRANALAAPTDALHDATGPHPWVLAVRGQRAVRLPVKPGLRGDARTEILEGVATGEELIPATNVLVKAGDRVRRAAGP